MKRIVAIAKIVYGRRIKKVYEFRLNASKHTVVVDIYDNQIPFRLPVGHFAVSLIMTLILFMIQMMTLYALSIL